jgi:DNA polymerase elongation subunit (family B)
MYNPTSASYSYSSKEGLQLHLRVQGRDLTIPAPFKPYFFVQESHWKVVEYYASRRKIPVHFESTDLKSLDGQRVVKVEVEQPHQVAYLRDLMSIESYEADIPYVRRVMIDKDWKTSNSYSKLYYDIECKDEKIVCIAVAGSTGQVEVLKGEEADILNNFKLFVEQVDMTLGYNSENYDYPILKKRFKSNNIEMPKMQRWYDLLPALQWMSQRMMPSWGLDWVGKNLLGMERVHADKPFNQLTLQEIYERCQRDVEIIRELDKKFNLSEVDIMKAHISYIFPDEANLITRCIDSLLLRKARELGYVLPNKPEKNSVQRHSGAFVAQPPEPLRIFRNVLFLDCVSLYPSIIINFKISPDPDRRLYPEMLSALMSERLKYKRLYRETGEKKYDNLQYAYKILANATYGAVNSIGFRIQRPDLGDEVARLGREIVTSLIHFYSSLGFHVIYADTDSCVLSDIEPDEKVFNMLAEAGSRHIKDRFGVEIQVEAKKFYSKLYFLRRASDKSAAKKRYAGYISWTSDDGWLDEHIIDMVGIEYVRSDYPSAAQRLQKQLVEGFLSGKPLSELQSILLSYKQALFNGLLSVEELALSKSITKKNYKVVTPHLKAAKKLEESGVRLNIGDKVRFVYTKWGPMPIELCRDLPIDAEYYWKRIFERIAERTLGISGEVKIDQFLRS